MSNKQHRSHRKIAEEAHSEGFDDGLRAGFVMAIFVALVIAGVWWMVSCDPLGFGRPSPEQRRIENIQIQVDNIERELDHKEYMERYEAAMKEKESNADAQ